jgi:CRP/FNR family transcriptional regulator, cyclic AMP receptor protein
VEHLPASATIPATQAERTAHLIALPLCEGLSDEDIDDLAKVVEMIEVQPGTPVVRRGEEGGDLFMIVAGTAEVLEPDTSGRAQLVAQMTPGEFFGEIGLLNSQPRTADVVASDLLRLMRLRRSDYFRFLSQRSDVHTQVTASAARRAGASLERMTSTMASQEDSLPAFDTLLHRLVDHEIDTMRAAEVRGDPVTFDEVVEFYGSTRFLYPAKLGVLESRFDAIRTTWERLISSNNEVFKILMLRRVENGQLAVKNSVSAFEYSPGCWQIQHLVSADRHERSGTLASMIGIIDWLYSREDVKCARWSYRSDNPGVSALFGGLASTLPSDRSLLAEYSYHVLPLTEALSERVSSDEIRVRPAEPNDVHDLAALYRTRHHLMPTWLTLDAAEMHTLSTKYESRGITRTREVLVAQQGEGVQGAIGCWWASEGMNFSFLENAMADLVIAPALPEGARSEIAKSLFYAAMDHYRARGRTYAVALTPTDSPLFRCQPAVLPQADKTYSEQWAAHDCFPAVRKYFESHYSRILFNEVNPDGVRLPDE